MEKEDQYDWLGFFVNFVIAAFIVWIFAILLYWKYGSYNHSEGILVRAGIFAIIVGLIAGIWRDRFWGLLQKVGAFMHYSRKP